MASLYKAFGNKLECLLCPHYCKLNEGQSGICGVRKNTGESIELMTYGVLSGYALDPIEKKPLYHFFPGQKILSIGSYGCNMRCDFCQNYNISQNVPVKLKPDITPENIVSEALSAENNIGIAFTYNEPVIWFEFMRDTALAAKKEGLYTVLVSNGYINRDPLKEMIQFIDAFNIDLKAFNNSFYRKLTGADIEPVKNSLIQIAKSGKHLEITTLIIPGHNDDEMEMRLESEWIAGELGKGVPLHLSRYFPMYRRDDKTTSQETLNSLFDIASENLNHVYMGNTLSDSGQNSSCPDCGSTVIKRSGYNIKLLNIDDSGRCTNCGTLVFKYFTSSWSKR
jgi:pyruvate formate lyase activating enzyme